MIWGQPVEEYNEVYASGACAWREKPIEFQEMNGGGNFLGLLVIEIFVIPDIDAELS